MSTSKYKIPLNTLLSGIAFLVFAFSLKGEALRVTDIDPWDETLYLMIALDSKGEYHEIAAIWGYLYAASIKALSLIESEPEKLFYFNAFLQPVVLSLLLLLAWTRSGIGLSISYLGALWSYLSISNLFTSPRISIFNSSYFLLLAIVFSTSWKRKIYLLPPFLVLSIYLRQDNLIFFLPLLGFLILKIGKDSGKKKLLFLSASTSIISAVALFTIVGNPFGQNRAWEAFIMNYYDYIGSAYPGMYNGLNPAIENQLPNSAGIISAIVQHPLRMAEFGFFNLREIPLRFPLEVFSIAPLFFHSKPFLESAHLEAPYFMASFFITLLLLFFLKKSPLIPKTSGDSLRHYLPYIGTFIFLKTVVVVFFFSYEERFVSELVFFFIFSLLLVLHRLLPSIKPIWDGTLFILIFVLSIAWAQSRPLSPYSQEIRGQSRFTEAVKILKSLDLPDVRVFANPSLNFYIFNKGFESEGIYEYFEDAKMAKVSLGYYLQLKRFGAVVLDLSTKRAFEFFGFSDQLNYFEGNPHVFNYRKVLEVDGLLGVYYPILGEEYRKCPGQASPYLFETWSHFLTPICQSL